MRVIKKNDMKKHIILTCMALATLASCSYNELKETAPEKTIGFRTPAITKGSELNNSNLKEFYVTALMQDGKPYFENVKFMDVVDYFTSNPSYYWPSEDTRLAFYAYAPALDIQAEVTQDKISLNDFTQSNNISEHKDLIIATAKNYDAETAAESGVSIDFSHKTAQFAFYASNSNTEYTYTVKGLRLGNLLSKGTLDLDSGTWDLEEETTVYTGYRSQELTLTSSYQSIMDDEDNAMVLPQTLNKFWDPENPNDGGAYFGILINITTKDGAQVYPGGDKGTFDWIAAPLYFTANLYEGYRYNIYLDFSMGAGWVAPDVEDNVNNTPGTVLGNRLDLNAEVTEWVEKQITPTKASEIAGEWKIYYFAAQDYTDEYPYQPEGEFDEVNYDTAETDEEKAEIKEFLKVAASDLCHFRIPESGDYIKPIGEDGNELTNNIKFSYSNYKTYDGETKKALYIDGPATEGWTIPYIDSIEDDPNNPGKKIVTLIVDRRGLNEQGNHIQYLKYHFTPLAQ